MSTVFDDVVSAPNPGDRVRLIGGLISYEVLDRPYDGSCGGVPDVRVVGVRRTELRKPDGINGTFVEESWKGQVPVVVWADIVRGCATVERAYAAPPVNHLLGAPKLSG